MTTRYLIIIIFILQGLGDLDGASRSFMSQRRLWRNERSWSGSCSFAHLGQALFVTLVSTIYHKIAHCRPIENRLLEIRRALVTGRIYQMKIFMMPTHYLAPNRYCDAVKVPVQLGAQPQKGHALLAKIEVQLVKIVSGNLKPTNCST